MNEVSRQFFDLLEADPPEVAVELLSPSGKVVLFAMRIPGNPYSELRWQFSFDLGTFYTGGLQPVVEQLTTHNSGMSAQKEQRNG